MKEVEGTEANCTTFDQLILSIEAKVQTIEASWTRLASKILRQKAMKITPISTRSFLENSL